MVPRCGIEPHFLSSFLGVDAVAVVLHLVYSAIGAAQSGSRSPPMGTKAWEGSSTSCGDIGCAVGVDVDVHGSYGHLGQLEFNLGLTCIDIAHSERRQVKAVAGSHPMGALRCDFAVLVGFTVCSAIRIFPLCIGRLVCLVEFGSVGCAWRMADAN